MVAHFPCRVFSFQSAITSTATAARRASADLEDVLDICDGRTSTAGVPLAKDHRAERWEKLLKYKDIKISYLKTMLDDRKEVEKRLEESRQVGSRDR